MSKKLISELSVSDLLGYLGVLQNLHNESSKMINDLNQMVKQGQFGEGGLKFLTKEREALEEENRIVSKKMEELREEVDGRFKFSLELDFGPGDMDVLFNTIQTKVQRQLEAKNRETNPSKADRPIRKINPNRSKGNKTTKKN